MDKWPSSGRRKVQFFVSFASAMSRHFKPNNSLCRYQQKREEAIQSARRQYLYNKLSNEQREAIDDQLDSSTYSFDDGLEEFVVNKECEVAADIRALHREGIHPALILGAFEAGNCTVEFPTGGFTTDKKRLLDVPLREDEFRSVDSDIDFEEDEVEAIDYEDFYIPPAMAEKGGALTSVFSLLAPTPSTSCCWNACHQLGSFTPTRGTCPTASEKAFSAACTDSLSFVPTTKSASVLNCWRPRNSAEMPVPGPRPESCASTTDFRSARAVTASRRIFSRELRPALSKPSGI